MTGGLVLAMALVAVVGGYVVACWVWPSTACRKCESHGKRRSPTGRAFKICRRCKGTGRRIRTGRRIFNWLRVLSQEGTR
jgi:DnaJ-class molecular chaperone